MKYKDIKEKRDKLCAEIRALQHVIIDDNNKDKGFEINALVKEKKKRYNFYNNLMKTYNRMNSNLG